MSVRNLPTPAAQPQSAEVGQLDRRQQLLTEKSRVARRVRMQLGSELTDEQIADQCGTAVACVVRWRNSERADAANVMHMLSMSDALFDAYVAALLDARVRLGHARRSLTAEFDPDNEHQRQLQSVLQRAADLLAKKA